MKQNGRMVILPYEEALLAEREITLRGFFELSDFLHTFHVLPVTVGDTPEQTPRR